MLSYSLLKNHAGILLVGQFSFWGNYIPRVFPMHLRGTGESFAANIGGRVLGTSMAWGLSAVVTVFDLPQHVYFEGGAAVITLVLLGKLLEARAKARTSEAIESLILLQPKGEPEYNMKELQATWEKLMAPNPAATAASGSADTVDAHSEASDIPPGQ